MASSLRDKVVIITGGSSGIGKACAGAFAVRGCRVVITGRDPHRLSVAGEEIKRQHSAAVLTVASDVSREDDAKRIMEETRKAFGRIDVLVNNAGLTMRALFSEVDLSVLKTLMEVNFWGTVYCTRHALPEVLKNRGSIVGISSVGGCKGLPGRTGYSASKFAMQGFLESLRIENLKNDLHVMVVCPGYTTSNIRRAALDKEGRRQGESALDEDKLMSAEAVAERVVAGVIRRKRTITLTAEGKLLVLLNKFFPAWMDRMVYRAVAKEADSPF